MRFASAARARRLACCAAMFSLGLAAMAGCGKSGETAADTQANKATAEQAGAAPAGASIKPSAPPLDPSK